MKRKKELSISFLDALNALEEERGISKEAIIEAIETALTSAYKKNYGENQNIAVKIDKETGGIVIFTRVYVVEEVEDENTEISLEEARELHESYEVGDVVEYHLDPDGFSRIAAQTAKQVVVQKIREIERGMVYDNFIEKQGTVVVGQVQRISNDTIFISIGKTEGLLPKKEQVANERFRIGDLIKVYVIDVRKTTKGPQVFVSRSHPNLVKGLFELEVPEIEEGIVEIKSIAREQGARTKIAVWTNDSNVDAIGACVGSKGNRVERITDELFGEKIDIINWSEDPVELISNVLNPATVEAVIIEEENVATVVVPDMQLSLAIGKAGQNVRLAARLCNWKLDIKSHSQYEEMIENEEEIEEEFPQDENIEQENVENIQQEEFEEEYAEQEDVEQESEQEDLDVEDEEKK